MSDESTAPWLQLTLEASEHTPEQLEDAFLEAKAIVVTLHNGGDQPVLEPLPGEMPLWPHTRVTGLFDAQTDIEVVKQTLCRFLKSDDLSECRMEALEDRDWVRAWMDDFHPMKFGRRLWVCPSNQNPPDATAVNLIMDPGLAFGTGTHPTTGLCLKWLDGADLANKSIIDYGCGSGILGIGALKLGASQVWAVDIDPQALLATERNAASNSVQGRMDLFKPENLPALKADILIANLLAGPLISLAPHFSTLVRPGGRLVLSGVLDYQADTVQDAFNKPFDFAPPWQHEDWILLQATRKRSM